MDKAETLVKETLVARIDQIVKLIDKTMAISDDHILWLKSDKDKNLQYGIRLTDRVKQAVVEDLSDELSSCRNLFDDIFLGEVSE